MHPQGPYYTTSGAASYGAPQQGPAGGLYGAGAQQSSAEPYGSSMPVNNAGPYGTSADPYGARSQNNTGPYGASAVSSQQSQGPYGSTAPAFGGSAEPYGGQPQQQSGLGASFGSSGQYVSQPRAGPYGAPPSQGAPGGVYGAGMPQQGPMGGAMPGYGQPAGFGGYGQPPTAGFSGQPLPQATEPIEEVKRVRFHMTNGYEFSLSIAVPHKSLIPRTDWVQDKDVNTCQGCDAPFTLLNRRHHCRRCGRIFCNNCCIKPIDILSDTGTDRLCKLCKAVMAVVDGPSNPLAYDVKPFLEDQSLSAFLMSRDYLMAAEYIRLIQNNLRNNDSRAFLVQYKPQVIYKSIELLDLAVRTTIEQASRMQYITLPQSQGGYSTPNNMPMMSSKDASTIISHSLGLLVNLTSTSNKSFASALAYIREIDTIGIIVSALTPEIDLVKQELAIWALRNITADPGCIPRIVEHKNFIPGIAHLLSTAVRATSEFITSLVGNIALAAPDYVPRLLPSAPVASIVSANIVSTHDILNFIIRNIDITAHVTQCMAMRLMGLFAKNAHSKDLLINYRVHELIVSAMTKRAVEFFTSAGNAAIALDTVLRYVKSETTANPMKDINESYVMSGGFFALGCFVELDEEPVTKAIVDGIFNSKELTLYLMRSISRETAYTCVESSYFLRVLLATNTKIVTNRICADEQYKNDFIRNIVIVLDRTFIMESVTTNCQEIISILQKSENSALATEINNKLKTSGGTQGSGGVNIVEALSSNYAGAEMNETDLKKQITGPYGVPGGMNMPGAANPYAMPQQYSSVQQPAFQSQPGMNPYAAAAAAGSGPAGPYGVGAPAPGGPAASNPYGSAMGGSSGIDRPASSTVSNPYRAGVMAGSANPYGAGASTGPYGVPQQQQQQQQQGYPGSMQGQQQANMGPYGTNVPGQAFNPTASTGPYGAPQQPSGNLYGAQPGMNPYASQGGASPYKPSGFQSEDLA